MIAIFTGIWDFAETYGCTKLLTKAIALLKRRFTVVVQTEEFLNISSSRLKNILHFEDLCLGTIFFCDSLTSNSILYEVMSGNLSFTFEHPIAQKTVKIYYFQHVLCLMV